MHKKSHKLLLLLLVMAIGVPSMLTFTGCSGKEESKENASGDIVSYITPDAVYAGIFYPKRILENQDLSFLPMEDATNEILEESGIDPNDIEAIVMTMSSYPNPRSKSPPDVGVAFRMTKSYSLDQLKSGMTRNTKKSTYNDRPCLVSKRPNGPTIYMPDDHTLLMATPSALDAMVANHKDPQKGAVRKLIDSVDSGCDAAIVLNIKPLRSLADDFTESPDMPQELQDFKQLPKLVNTVRLQAKALDNPLLTLDLVTDNSTDAKKVQNLTRSFVNVGRKLLDDNLQQIRKHSRNAHDQAVLQQVEEVADILQKNLKSTVNGNMATWTLNLPREKQIEILKEIKEKTMAKP